MADLFTPDSAAGVSLGRPGGSPRRNHGRGTFPSPEAAIARMGESSGRWIYHASDGSEAFIVFRFDSPEGKTYRPVHPTPTGWSLGDPPGELPLFRLPELADAPRIYIGEGEKVAE